MGRLNFAVNILHPAVLSVLLFSVDYPLHFSMNSLVRVSSISLFELSLSEYINNTKTINTNSC